MNKFIENLNEESLNLLIKNKRTKLLKPIIPADIGQDNLLYLCEKYLKKNHINLLNYYKEDYDILAINIATMQLQQRFNRKDILIGYDDYSNSIGLLYYDYLA